MFVYHHTHELLGVSRAVPAQAWMCSHPRTAAISPQLSGNFFSRRSPQQQLF